MRQKFLLGYSLLLLLAIVISILALTFESYEISFLNLVTKIVLFFKWIKVPFFFDHFLGYQALIYLSIPYLISFLLSSGLSNEQRHALRKLGHATQSKNEKGKITFVDATFKKNKKYLELTTSNLGVELEQVVRDKEQYEAIFRSKFSRIEKLVNEKSLSFRFFYDKFDSMNANKLPHLKPWELYLGLDAEAKPITLKFREQFSVYSGGTTGSGKTTTNKNIITALKAVTPNLRVIIVDSKLMDYDDDFISKNNIELYPANSISDLEKVVELFEGLKAKALSENMDVIRSNRFSHAEDCHSRNIPMPISRTLIVLDEAGRYLKATGSKEQKEVKKRLIELVTDSLAMFRAHSIAIIVSTQRVHADEMDIPFDNFQVMLLNGLSKEMSAKYTDGQVSSYPTLGKWYVRSDRFNGFIKTPSKIECRPADDTKSGRGTAI